MPGFVCFIISFFLVLYSSYYLTSSLKPKRVENALIFLALISFSQVVVSMELLSIFKFIYPASFLGVNIVVFLIAASIRKYQGCPEIDFSPLKQIKCQIIETVKKDKSLMIMLAFLVMVGIISLLLALVMPSNSADSMAYHLARIPFWIQNHTLAHFETSSLRQTVFAINSEILIMWSLMFLKHDYLAAIPEYLAYWGNLFVLYSFLRYLRISTGRVLWAVLILASLPAVIIEASSTQTNLIMGFLLLSSFYLFVYGTREWDKKALAFSAISYSLALGTKNTALLFLPVFAIAYLLISIKERKQQFYKPLGLFLLYSVPAFILLASYNYALNFIDYGSPFGSEAFIAIHRATTAGFKAFLASIIKYSLLFFDFTGIKEANFLTPYMISVKNILFNLLGLKDSDGLIYMDITKVNVVIHENFSLFGILGFLLIIPLAFRFGYKIFKFKNDRAFYISLSGLIIIGFVISISAMMGFCLWFDRFFTTAIVLSSPILIYSYKRDQSLLKIAIVGIVIFNYLTTSICNSQKPLIAVSQAIATSGYKEFRFEARFKELDFNIRNPYYYIVRYFKENIPDNSKIALILPGKGWFYPFFEENSTWKLYPARYDLMVKNNTFNDYDYILTVGNNQEATVERKSDIVYNYSLKNNRPVLDKTKPYISLYYDRNRKLVNSGNPVTQLNLIDFAQIPKNFKLIKIIQVQVAGSKNPKDIGWRFYVLKKLV